MYIEREIRISEIQMQTIDRKTKQSKIDNVRQFQSSDFKSHFSVVSLTSAPLPSCGGTKNGET